MLNFLWGFHRRSDSGIMGKIGKHVVDGEWEYLLVPEAQESAVLPTIQKCIQRRQVIIAAQMECHPIYEICTKS